MRFTDVLGRTERSELSQLEAAELLGISERTFRRWRDRQAEMGRRVWLTAVSERRCGERQWPRSSGCLGFTATSIAASP